MKFHVSGFIILTFLLVSCKSKDVLPSTPTIELTSIAESTATQVSEINSICPPISDYNDFKNDINGKLLYIDYNNYIPMLLNLETLEKESFIKEDEQMSSYALSPNGKFFSYEAINPKSNQNELVILNMQNTYETEVRIKWEDNWDRVAYWLNNHSLFIKLFPDENYKTLLLNPFSGEQQILIADFFNIYSLDSWPPDWNGLGQFVYNNNMNRVIYADNNQKFILWDTETNKELTHLQFMTFRQFPTKSPQWNQNGNEAIIAAPKSSLEFMNDELFLINQNGEIKQLTNFTDSFSNVSINRYGWSYDSQNIAMFVSVKPGDYIEQLAIFNIGSNNQTIYCIEGDASITNSANYRRSPNGFFDSPIYQGVIWSQDSTKIIFENRVSETSSKIFLVDIITQNVYEIFNNVNYLPVGWITN
jgi:hypothetical protein